MGTTTTDVVADWAQRVRDQLGAAGAGAQTVTELRTVLGLSEAAIHRGLDRLQFLAEIEIGARRTGKRGRLSTTYSIRSTQ